MTDATITAYEAKYIALQEAEAEILPRNKAMLFDALQAAGISTVVIEFEGSGDSGQMDQPCARDAAEAVVALPDEKLDLGRLDWNLSVHRERVSLTEAIERMA